jgi:NAD(P)-dependent dehydrogenase (short-subunit alcohol dehydrogenase family)
MVARDRARGEAVHDALFRATGNGMIHLVVADLATQADVRRVAAEFLARHDRLHVLVNDAGAVFGDRQVTRDGLEQTFALNHVAPFLLTNLLLDTLVASAPSRVITVSSDAARSGRLDLRDLQAERRYRGMAAYGASKLANVVFTFELARRLAGTGVTANAMTPGFTKTSWGADMPGLWGLGIRLGKVLARSPEKGAETVVYLAQSPAVAGVSGGYFHDLKQVKAPSAAYDERLQDALWRASARLTGLPAASSAVA